jgi:hypothetical protein
MLPQRTGAGVGNEMQDVGLPAMPCVLPPVQGQGMTWSTPGNKSITDL